MSLLEPPRAASYARAISSTRFGVRANTNTDQTSRIQAMLTEAGNIRNGLGVGKLDVYFDQPGSVRTGALTVPEGVRVHATGVVFGPPTAINGYMWTLNGHNSMLEGAHIQGGGAALGVSGVTIPNGVAHSFVTGCSFDGLAGTAIRDSGLISKIEHCVGTNIVMDADGLTDYRGAIELRGVDTFARALEFGTSRPARGGFSAGKFAVGCIIGGANIHAMDILAETSDHGIVIDGSLSLHSVNLRAQYNLGHGFLIIGGDGHIISPHSQANSGGLDLGYDEMHANGGQFVIIGAQISGAGNVPRANYAISDNNFSSTQFNKWIAPAAGGTAGGIFIPPGANRPGTAFLFPNGGWARIGSATPNVAFGNSFSLANTTATNLTDMFGGVDGQTITLLGDGFSTIIHDPTKLILRGGANMLAAAETAYQFTRRAQKWYQL